MKGTAATIALAVGSVLLISGTTYDVSRWVISNDMAIGKHVADSIAAAQAAMHQPEDTAALTERKRQLADLLDTLEAKLVERPTDSMLVISAANIAYDLEEFGKAEKHYRTFLEKVDPKNQQVAIDYGFVLFQLGRADEGIAKVEEIVQRQPKNQTALYNLGLMYIRSNRPEQALEWMKRCESADPTSDIGKRATTVINSLQHSS